MYLLPGTPVIQCGPNSVQFGSDSKTAWRLKNLTANEIALMKQLPHCGGDIDTLATQLQIEPRRLRELKRALTSLPLTSSHPHHSDSPDCLWWQRVHGDDRYIRSTKRRRVMFPFLPPLAYVTVDMLASFGVDAIVVADDRPVSLDDLHVFDGNSFGSPRNSAAITCLSRSEGQIIRRATRWDISVSVTPFVWDMVQAQQSLSDGVVFLPVMFSEAAVWVGPLTIPGWTACVNCMLHHRIDDNVYHPYQDLQLADVSQPAVESLLMTQAAAVVSRAVINYLAHMPTGLENMVYRFDATSALPTIKEVTPHKECGCSASINHAQAA